MEVRIITNITGTNSIFRDHLFSTDMILRYLMCTQRGRYVAAEYIDTSRLQYAYVYNIVIAVNQLIVPARLYLKRFSVTYKYSIFLIRYAALDLCNSLHSITVYYLL